MTCILSPMSSKRTRKPSPRPPFGERLYAARLRAGLTQAELGERVGMSQRGIANWEIRPNSSPTTEQLAQLSDVLDISVEELVRGDAEEIRKRPGPKGKLVRVFEEVSLLPRSQQKDMIEVIEMLTRSKKRKAEAQASRS